LILLQNHNFDLCIIFISIVLPCNLLTFILHGEDGILLIEADRLLKPGGYFVWTSPLTNARNKANQKRWKFIQDFTSTLCWELLSQQDETVVWKKTSKKSCYASR